MFGFRFVPRLTPLASRLTQWSGRRDSNPRPTAWKAVTLPLSYSRNSGLRRVNVNRKSGNRFGAFFLSFPDYRFSLPDRGGQGRIRTSVARSAADLQSAAINHSATCPSSKESNDPACARRFWSRRWDSNPQPSDYKSDALPLSYAGDLPAFKEHTIPRQARTAKCSSQHMSNQALSPGELRLCRTAS